MRLLFLNSYLLRPVSLGVRRRRWEPGSAPAVTARALELGRALAGEYDVVALSEAFRPEDRRRVLAGWRHAGRDVEVAYGPEPGWDPRQGATIVSSGLMTIADGPRIVRRDQHRYRVRGSRLVDADPWASKAALLVELDVGLPGNVELYSTHLCAGGGLLPLAGSRLRATDRVRMAQARELAGFVARAHRPGNLAVVVGDMNVAVVGGPDHDPSGPHRELEAILAAEGLEDLWSAVGDGHGPTCTQDHETATVGRRDPDDPRFAWDAAPAATGELVVRPRGHTVGQRIDRAFLQRPDPAHGIVVRAARMRRRSFPRRLGAPERHRLTHLSDHLGLHIELDLGPAQEGSGLGSVRRDQAGAGPGGPMTSGATHD